MMVGIVAVAGKKSTETSEMKSVALGVTAWSGPVCGQSNNKNEPQAPRSNWRSGFDPIFLDGREIAAAGNQKEGDGMKSESRTMMLIGITLMLLIPGCEGPIRTSASPAGCYLVSETEGEGMRSVTLASGEKFFLEEVSFDTSSLAGLPQRLTSNDPTSPIRFKFKDRARFDSFIVQNQGRSLAIELNQINVVIRGEIAIELSDMISFAGEGLSTAEMEALGGWGWSPSNASPVEYCLVRETPTATTRAVTDLYKQTVHIEPASFNAKMQNSAGSSGTGTRKFHTLHFYRFADPEISTMTQFLAKYDGHKLALVHQDVAVTQIPVQRHVPGHFLLKGVSEKDLDLLKQELRNWR